MKFAAGIPHEYLKGKTNFLLFYNSSLRTRNSFEAGMTQLGCHAHFLSPSNMYAPGTAEYEYPDKLLKKTKEDLSDTARVLSRYGHAIYIRIFQDASGWVHRRGNVIVREYAKLANIPVINMECDVYHPCQALADLMTIKEKLGTLEGKKLPLPGRIRTKTGRLGSCTAQRCCARDSARKLP